MEPEPRSETVRPWTSWVAQYVVALVVFLVLDLVWLTTVAAGFYADQLGPLLREPANASQVWGVALPGLHPDNLQILGREVVPVPGAEWRNGDIDSALGQRVRATVEAGTSKRLLAKRLQVRQPGVDRIVGRIDSMQHLADGSIRLKVLGFTVAVPPAVRQRTNLPPATLQRLELVARDLRTPALPLQSSSIRWEDPEDFFGRAAACGHACGQGSLP